MNRPSANPLRHRLQVLTDTLTQCHRTTVRHRRTLTRLKRYLPAKQQATLRALLSVMAITELELDLSTLALLRTMRQYAPLRRARSRASR